MIFLVPRWGFVLLVCIFVSLSGFVSALSSNESPREPLKLILGEGSLGPLRDGISNDGTDTTLVLAETRTNRPDVLNGFKLYRGGWNITNPHYWAVICWFHRCCWFRSGSCLAFLIWLGLVVHYCCRCRINIKGKGSNRCQRICLLMLMVFTCSAAIGCILLSVGQDEFHHESLHTLEYVVHQSDYTVQTLKMLQYLALTKTINVAQVFLPSDVMDHIDKLNGDLNDAADVLWRKQMKMLGRLRSALITVAAVMLVLALVGFFLSIFRHRHAIHIFVASGWILVAVTFILCGVFLVLNNAISDTCLAMEEWVDNPTTTNNTLIQSKEVINDIVTVVNTYIYTFANVNPSPTEFNYYNQSGPFLPPLCYPFDSQLQVSQCGQQEISMANASLVWKSYICEVSSSGLCATPGRATPDAYRQLVAAVNESYALEYYTPILLSLQDCKFVRDTFQEITRMYCPPLERYLKIVSAGLGLISVGVLLCLVLWMLYANRPQREEEFVKQSFPINSRKDSQNNESSEV
ncbi:hypothetical protein K2173_013069 [Erythroxylum novogranatense]|uniref:Uncharacterized protein n=1 Tax=Erythroxylum novogranatense TaxID=1862640 RepID=A0AAV8S6D5_9ROSI|nr:hypothetical protein K2173_013069 [Erythroxylum novogranatense]